MKLKIIMLLLIIISMLGCEYVEEVEEPTLEELKKEYWEKQDIDLSVEYENYVRYDMSDKGGNSVFVIAYCRDEVICYDGYSSGGSCFRDKDLVDKYCNYKLSEVNESG